MDLARRVASLTRAGDVRELAGGHQSRVFVVDGPDQRLVAKVRRAADVDRAALDARLEVVADLAAVDPHVCAPVPIDGALVASFEADGDVFLVTCSTHAEGSPPDPARPADAARMGRALAELHTTMATLDPKALPLVGAMRTVRPDWDGPSQLLHGDFNAGNIQIAGDHIRIFDFDDCGYGPPAFDVANALYMVRFDDLTGGRPGTDPPFHDAFVAGYQEAASTVIDLDEVRAFVDMRVDALERWLDDPSSAPIGIRSSSPEWHATLRRFVDDHRNRAGDPG